MSNYIRNGDYAQILAALRDGSCLVVSGVRMSGRSSLLARLSSERDVMLRPSLIVRGIGVDAEPLDAVRMALRFAHQTVPPSTTEVIAELTRYVLETDGPIVIDDAHILDRLSLVHLEQVAHDARRPVVVATSASDARLRRDGRTLFPDALHLPLPPVGMEEASTLVAAALGGATESGATARMLTKSGGIPGLIVTLARDARRTGAMREVDGVWVPQRRQWAARAARTVLAMTDELSDLEVKELTRLAIVGTVDGETAEKITGRETLAALERHGFLHKQANDENISRVRVTVFPELLADHLRNGVDLFGRRELFASLSTALPDSPVLSGDGALRERRALLLEDLPSVDMDGNLAAAVQENLAAQLAVRREQWEHHRSLRDAVDLLELLIARGASRDEVRTFLAEASELPARNESELVRFRLREARWRAWFDADPEGAITLLEKVRSTVSGEFALVLRAMSTHLASLSGLSGQPDEAWATSLRFEYPTVVPSLELLAHGCYQDALNALPTGPHVSQSVANLVEYTRMLALTMGGDLDGGVELSRAVHADAVSRRDPEAVVLMSNILGLQLIMLGRPNEAITVLTDALALGYTIFPFTPVHVSNLVMLAILQGRRSHRKAALMTQRVAASYGIRYGGIPMSSPEIAAAFIEYYSEEEGAADAIWDACMALVSRGYIDAAISAWALAGPWSEERNSQMTEWVERRKGTLFQPAVRVQRALGTGQRDDLIASHHELLELGRDYFAATVAVHLASLAEEDRDDYLHWFERAATISRASGNTLYEVMRFPMKLGRLSGREREVFDLMTTNYGNQEIADQLFISVRTVENHVIRVLRKLELHSRKEIIEVWSQRSY